MSEQRTSESAEHSGRGVAAGKGLLRVGDHVGQSAREAAQAIRRVGLRPGLERCSGYADELIGRVVDQEPAAGAELPRNGVVRIFVAAPARENGERGAASAKEQPFERVPAESDPQVSERGAADEPETPHEDDERAVTFAGGERERPANRVDEDERPAVDPVGEARAYGSEPPTEEQLVARAQEVFAGRAVGDRRRGLRNVWPAWTRRRPRARRGWLARAIWGMLVLWLTAGLIAAVIGGSSHTTAQHGEPRSRKVTRAGLSGHQQRGCESGEPASSPTGRFSRAHARDTSAGGRLRCSVERRRVARDSSTSGTHVTRRARSAGSHAAAARRSARLLPGVSRAHVAPGVAVPVPDVGAEQVGGGPFSP